MPEGAGFATAFGTALRRDGDLRGTTEQRGPAGTGDDAWPQRGAVGQRRLRRYGHYQGGPAGAGDDGGAGGVHRDHWARLQGGGRPGAPAAGGPQGLRRAAEGGHGGHVPDREPG